MSEFTEKATQLQEKISLYQRKNFENDFDRDDQLKIENEWGASYLCSALLERSSLQEFFFINIEKLNGLCEQFNKKTGRKCDLDSLFSRNWLRLVNDKVHIAGTIRAAVLKVEKVVGLDNEFSFFRGLQTKYGDKKISEEDFLNEVNECQKKNRIALDLERPKKNHWIEIKEKQVTISNLVYFKPIFENIDDFLFLKQLYDLLSKDTERNLKISIEALSEILIKHQTTFPATPSLEVFLEKKVFTQLTDGYTLNFYRNDIGFGGLICDKIGALLWERLIKNSSFKDDVERIRFWHDRIINYNDWCNIGNFFQAHLKLRFLDAAMTILMNEKDLSSGEDEFSKLKLDKGYRISDLAYILSSKRNELQFPVNSDLFDLYDGLNAVDDKWRRELMFHQDSRIDLTYFIHQIVRNEPGCEYERIFKLLEAGTDKSFLLWQTCFVIHYCEPKIIPFLLLNEFTAALAFSLLSETKKNNGIFHEKLDLYKEIACNCFQLLCDFLAKTVEVENDRKARIIFQSLLTVENEKFTTVGPNLSKQQRHKREGNEIVARFQSIFENTELPGIYYSGTYSTKKLMNTILAKELFEEIKNYNPVDYFGNNAICLPFVKLDMLIWVLQLEKKNSEHGIEGISYDICRAFLNSYLEAMNSGLRKTWDYETEKMVDKVPIWSSQYLNLELVHWKKIVTDLEKEKLLDNFLNPSGLQFNIAKDKYETFNGFVLNKIRTHLSILLIVFNDLYNNKFNLTAEGLPVSSVLDKVEAKITSLIGRYSKDDPEKERLDIFGLLHERTFWSTDKEELLPVIGSSINRFKKENKTEIIKELIRSDHLVRIFKLLDNLVSEKDKDSLLALITAADIQQFFLNTFENDGEFVLQRLAEEQIFKEKAKLALEIWEKREFRHLQNEKVQHLIICFRMKLLLAYHELDEEEINKIPNPSLHGGIVSLQFSPHKEKDFYKALIFLKRNEPEKSYRIFDSQLKESKEDRPILALNRFASKLQWAEQTKDLNEKRKLFHEAIQEWDQFEKKAKDTNVEYIKDKIWYNKLHAYSGLQNEPDFDSEFNRLDKPFQLRPDFLELRIKNLMERNMQQQAEVLLSEAEEYHRLSDGELPESILKLRELTDTIDTEKYLQEQYLRIFSQPPEKLIKILPGNLNKFSSLKEFILSELVGSATDMLTFINSISEIGKEDKFSDLMVLSLINRLRNFGWHIGPARGGFPESIKPNLGLIDYAISSANKDRIAVCEALKLEGKNRSEVQSHHFKIFNYDSVRRLYYVIVYFKGDGNKFNQNWENYKTDISTAISYPDGFEIQPGSLEDISEKFGTDSIAIAKSFHGASTSIYHLFININYSKARN